MYSRVAQSWRFIASCSLWLRIYLMLTWYIWLRSLRNSYSVFLGVFTAELYSLWFIRGYTKW